MGFENLQTVTFQEGLKAAAHRIYQKLFPGCFVEDLRADGFKVHVLDKEFGIDKRLYLGDNSWFTIQEKYRNHDFLVNENRQVDPPWPDFTQEYKNAAGTDFETPGEWFHLGAQLYFYGWANRAGDDFRKWVILDVVKYKQIVDAGGGLESIGKLYGNGRHGRATFYAIPLHRLMGAVIYRDSDLAAETTTNASTELIVYEQPTLGL